MFVNRNPVPENNMSNFGSRKGSFNRASSASNMKPIENSNNSGRENNYSIG
jgi:hypothetical protein